MSKVPLHALPGFVAAARLGNLSRAAASLHLTVSALSHQVRGLEEQLGQRLFDRGPRGLRLTPAGERLFGQVAPPLDALSLALAPQPARSPDT
ncbi:MAG TPA: LysR family transcriptional regulator, partial [Myxococcaceae bacterium]|nr:LysR family transcriptional regulator [Myxococcaceae bacterium]